MELNGSITVTCIFATGASSTGCQVTIFMIDSSEEVLSTNITRPNGASQVCEHVHDCSEALYIGHHLHLKCTSFMLRLGTDTSDCGSVSCDV